MLLLYIIHNHYQPESNDSHIPAYLWKSLAYVYSESPPGVYDGHAIAIALIRRAQCCADCTPGCHVGLHELRRLSAITVHMGSKVVNFGEIISNSHLDAMKLFVY